ncbi:MAG: SDR family oxidoreductase [Planctomycetia bacterium]|nr:SDR family oxidoreductase [Planctomycetia bacterium]
MDWKRSARELQGVRAAVLGSTSGVGRAVALTLARSGADVIVHGRSSRTEANVVADEIRSLGGRSHIVMADLADRQAGDRLVTEAWDLWGGLDAWLHIAGADILTGQGRRSSFDDKLDTLLAVDVVSTIRLTREVGRRMRAAGRGRIVTMGWDQAETGMEGDSGELFAATKGAILAFTRSLALSLAPTVQVNAVAPGWIKTSWGESTSRHWNDRVLRETPLKRWGTPDDVAEAVRFPIGRLAEPALRQMLDDLGPRSGFQAEVAVLPISVAALMTPRWVAHHLKLTGVVDRVILPGHCRGDLSAVEQIAGAPVDLGPEDFRDLPRYFGGTDSRREGYGKFDIEILAEINHAPRLTLDEIVATAEHFRSEGADVIDVGCDPGERWHTVGATVEELRRRGFRVSIDSFDPLEVVDAARAGAELVLSVNATNRAHAKKWGVEVVAIPDVPGTWQGLDETVRDLRDQGVPFRLDPILEPIGFGFAASLGRYLEARSRYPGVPVMMGIGNLTELTDADSAGVNTLLVGVCQELGVRSVLTTEVINWARSSVKEIDLARRLMYHAVTNRSLPKHVEPGLVALRDVKVPRFGPQNLAEMASRVKDHNWRIFAEDGVIVAINGTHLFRETDPFLLFERMDVSDPSHAFYLGYEMMKAKTSLTLSKNYRQDQALDWGYLTDPEVSHLDRKKGKTGGGSS